MVVKSQMLQTRDPQGVASGEDGIVEYIIRQPGTHPRLRPVD